MQTDPRVRKFKKPDYLLQMPLPLLLPTLATALLKTDSLGWFQLTPLHKFFIFSTFHILIFSPCTINKQGTGIIASAKKASNELPHPRPNTLYIFGPASGSTAAMTDLVSVFAASAEAA
jgi:hypothetical protein